MRCFMQLEIPPEEVQVLLKILNNYRAELRAEIYRTEGAAYKRDLKQEEELLERLLARVEKGHSGSVRVAS